MAQLIPLADSYLDRYTTEQLLKLVEEIQLELDAPTQVVRDIVANPQTEEECRSYLQAFNTYLRSIIRV